ncbi:MAG TPA: hypothetical protein VFI33_01135 [Puia sp.]|nr:hypothetical protein [Puia sp.]
MENLRLITTILFTVTTAIAIAGFHKAFGKSSAVFRIILIWTLLQGLLGLTGYYIKAHKFPPPILLLLLPAVFTIIILFTTTGGQRFMDRLDPGTLTRLHVIRIPIEIVLYLLYMDHQVPEIMTFAGGNYDIISGITAPVIYYYGYVKKSFNRIILLCWNFICLGLLLNIIARAVLSTPSPIQKLAFDQPNIAIFHFPYNWLPSVIVPMVLFSHLACIRSLFRTVPYQKRTVARTPIL